MAFVQRNVFKTIVPKINQFARPLSTHVEKSVFISQSNDVYTNLALEEWLGKNFNLQNHHVMLYYKNDPCVVLGKGENPWLDTNIAKHHENEENVNISLARRQGNCSTLYQDHGMGNFTFFGASDHFDKRYNLAVIKRAMFRKYNLKVQQEEDNLTFYNMKISGSGAKFGSKNAYQNCSLFVDVNKADLICALEKEAPANENEAHKQCYLNITEIDPKISNNGLLTAIGWEFLRTAPFTLKDGGTSLAAKQRGFQMVNPTEKWFPGITEIRDKLVNWDWCYGKTPSFTITRTFPVPAQFLTSPENSELRINLQVNEGKIRDVTLFVPPGMSSTGFTGEAKVVTGLKGHRFSEEAMNSLETILGIGNYEDEKEKFVTDCVRQAMSV